MTPYKSIVDSAEACYNILGKLYAEKGWLFLMNNNVERWVSMKEITDYESSRSFGLVCQSHQATSGSKAKTSFGSLYIFTAATKI